MEKIRKRTVVTRLPAGEINDIKEQPDGTFEVIQTVIVKEEDCFVLVDAERLSLNDEFLRYQPRTRAEEFIKNLIIDAIKAGVKNFYCSEYDPSFTDDGCHICYVTGKAPAVGKTCIWWEKEAREYDPSRNSRLGTFLEYAAFLGVTIKNLVEGGYCEELVWDEICNDSERLGHYANSEDVKTRFEPTCSRYHYGFYDWANTFKILARDAKTNNFVRASGCYLDSSLRSPIGRLVPISPREDRSYEYSTGWIVLS